jgi:multicomponent Na+:H+ antiporter subunit E
MHAPDPPAAPSFPARRRHWALQTFVLLLLVWLALDGVRAIAVGVGFAAIGAAIGSWLVPGEPYRWRPLRLVMFLLYFIRASFRGGVDVARRALHPRLPVAPGYLDYRCGLPAGLPRTAFVGIVSLLPGSLSVAMDEDGRLRVHMLTLDADDTGLAELEAQLRRLFSLDAADADGAPPA